MKRMFLLLCFSFFGTSVDAKPYLFFLHNMFLELYTLSDVHPDYGKVEYTQVLDAFSKAGFEVISEIRPKGTDGRLYASKVVRQIDSLLVLGVKPGDITVVGTSKGGYIAQYVSTKLRNPLVNFVFIGSCSGGAVAIGNDINFCGNILSIYEHSDVSAQSCDKMKAASSGRVTRFKEVEVNTGLKHGFLFKAMPQWLNPTIKWARQQYD